MKNEKSVKETLEVSKIIIKEPDNNTVIFDKNLNNYDITGLNYCLHKIEIDYMEKSIDIIVKEVSDLKYIYLELKDIYKGNGKRKILSLYNIFMLHAMTNNKKAQGFIDLNYNFCDYRLGILKEHFYYGGIALTLSYMQ